MRVTIGKGVMSKDGRTPFAPGIMMAERVSGWNTAEELSWSSFALLMKDKDVVSIRVVDEDNNQFIFKKDVNKAIQERMAQARADRMKQIAESIAVLR